MIFLNDLTCKIWSNISDVYILEFQWSPRRYFYFEIYKSSRPLKGDLNRNVCESLLAVWHLCGLHFTGNLKKLDCKAPWPPGSLCPPVWVRCLLRARRRPSSLLSLIICQLFFFFFHFLIFLLLYKYSCLHFPPTIPQTPAIPTFHLRSYPPLVLIKCPLRMFLKTLPLCPPLSPPTSPLVSLSLFLVSVFPNKW